MPETENVILLETKQLQTSAPDMSTLQDKPMFPCRNACDKDLGVLTCKQRMLTRTRTVGISGSASGSSHKHAPATP